LVAVSGVDSETSQGLELTAVQQFIVSRNKPPAKPTPALDALLADLDALKMRMQKPLGNDNTGFDEALGARSPALFSLSDAAIIAQARHQRIATVTVLSDTYGRDPRALHVFARAAELHDGSNLADGPIAHGKAFLQAVVPAHLATSRHLS